VPIAVNMADPLKTTVAIVATPQALEDVRHRLRRSGIRTAEMEVAEMQLERKVMLEGELLPDGTARSLVLAVAGGAAVGVMLVAGWMQVVAAGPALLGCLGGAAIGGAVHFLIGLWRQQGRETVVSRRRSFWKVRLGGDATLIAKARGLASRTGATIRRVSTGAFEVAPGRKPKG
jgi:hypothetical protein